GRAGHEPIRPTRDLRPPHEAGPGRDPLRRDPLRRDPLRRDALRAALERPLDEPLRPSVVPGGLSESRSSRPAAMAGGLAAGADDEGDPKEIPAVPSLAVVRSRRPDTGPRTRRRRARQRTA